MAARPVGHVLRRAAPGLALTVLLCQTVGGLATTAWLMATATALNALVGPVANAQRLLQAAPALLACGGLYVLKLALDGATAWARARLVPRVQQAAQSQLLDASLHVDLAAFDDAGFYDQLHRARDRGVMHMQGASDCLVEALSALLAVLGAALALVWLKPMLLPVLAIALWPQAWGAFAVARLQFASMPATISLTRQVGMLAELATERESAPEIRSYQAQAYLRDEHGRSAQALQDHLVALGLAEAKTRTLARAASGLGLAFTFAVLGWLLWTDQLALAVAGTTVIAVRAAGASVEHLVQVASELFEKALYLADYQAFLDQARQRAPRGGAEAAPAAPALIALDQVSFHYEGQRSRPALQDVSLQIRAGETVALVGENGSGKTTLAKLLAGLYTPSRGTVQWDGTDVRRFTPESVADRVAMVLQHPVRWPRSARDNVRIGRHDRAVGAEAALQRAASLSRADEVVARLAQGWDTLLSRHFRGGTDLSSGQWQRLAVARGLYRDAPIVIWDEPTAPLDAKAEYAVYESLRQLSAGRTVVLITHRLASVRNADRILFLEQGRLVEQGRHEELLALNGRYAELYRLQARLHGIEPASTS
jgi:ABC-type multidrug transport system fused ATPase/permease subunit